MCVDEPCQAMSIVGLIDGARHRSICQDPVFDGHDLGDHRDTSEPRVLVLIDQARYEDRVVETAIDAKAASYELLSEIIESTGGKDAIIVQGDCLDQGSIGSERNDLAGRVDDDRRCVDLGSRGAGENAEGSPNQSPQVREGDWAGAREQH